MTKKIFKLQPKDLTDIGQATVFTKYCGRRLRWSPSTGFLVYNGHCWEEDNTKTHELIQQFTDKQLAEVETFMKKCEKNMNSQQCNADPDYQKAKKYKNFVLQRRDSAKIRSTLNESHPKLKIDPNKLDADPFLLCTPKMTYDLRQGLSGGRDPDPKDFITKSTTVSPSDKGLGLWQDFLDQVFQKDRDLINYVQEICGLAVIGQVKTEALIIAYGDGANGKSTFWNTVAKVLGAYSRSISPDILTMNCKRNVKPELAEIRGKRLLVASELSAGMQLNEALIKQLTSTDEIVGEKKFKDSLPFTPSHILVLYTNHLPRISSTDNGTWRRIIVIPFNACFNGQKDIKNYSEFLFENAGEAVLQWIIEGAKKIINAEYHLSEPECVKQLIKDYKKQNDIVGQFIEDCCEIGEQYAVNASILYKAYRNYCTEYNEHIYRKDEFKKVVEKEGFTQFVEKRLRFYSGLRLQ